MPRERGRNMEVDYKELEYLRKHTYLGPIKKMKVLSLRDDAEQYQAMMIKFENCNPGIDYSEAEELEYKYRMQVWKRSFIYLWMEYGDGQDLDTFAKEMLHEAMAGQKLFRKKSNA